MRFLLVLWLYAAAFTPAAAALTLDTNHAPPYQINQHGNVTGLSVDVLKCVMQQLHTRYAIRIMPWRRAQQNVQRGISDGVFSVMPLDTMEPYAVLSSPLVLEKWYWYARDSAALYHATFPAGLRIGVLRGSNQEGWLEQNHLMPTQTVNRLENLFKLLEIGRVDVVLADQLAMQVEPALAGKQLAARFERYMPLGVYFSTRLLTAMPDFLGRFNTYLANCHGQDYRLSSAESQAIRQLVENDVQRWRKQAALVQQLRHLPHVDKALVAHDREWQQRVAAGGPYPVWMLAILQSPLSRALAQWQARQRDLYPEVFVSLADGGQLLATSHLTSDYWQGDEEKVSKTVELAHQAGEQTLVSWIDRCTHLSVDEAADDHAGCIAYDDSSQKFIAHISFALWIEGKVAAVMTFGVNVEAALQRASQSGQ